MVFICISFSFAEIMTQLAESIPELDGIAEDIKKLASDGESTEESLAMIEVTLPMLCRSAGSSCNSVI